MFDMIKDKVILITGGTGFLGRALINKLLKYNPQSIRILSRDEVKHHNVQEIFKNNEKLRHFLGDVRDYPRLLKAIRGTDIVIHAAALKRVDMIEYNVEEVIKTNILGSLNVIRACLEDNVEKAIFISTDKACSPINTYGACKFVGERIFTESNYNKGNARTIFTVVRYGNVLESTGSVIPSFIKKIKNKENIPLTDRRMTRFIITQEQAVSLILKAIRHGVGGEVFIPKLPSMRILDLAEVLKQEFNAESEIEETGIRPGEKIHEIMINDSESPRTYEFNGIYVIDSCLLKKFISKSEAPEYIREGKKFDKISKKEYSSEDYVISREELKGILDDLELK
jgi:UDP-N-acetylglucosamine 4,6-dehydratase/5-epimerase